MIIFDIIVLIFIGLAFYKGFRSGLLRQLASLGAILLGGWVAHMFMPKVASILNGIMQIPPEVLNVIAFLTAFIIIAGLLYAVALFLGKVLQNIGLGIFNSLAGAAVSIFTCLIVISLLINSIELIDRTGWLMKNQTRKESYCFYPLRSLSTFVFPYFGELYQEIKKFKEHHSSDTKETTESRTTTSSKKIASPSKNKENTKK